MPREPRVALFCETFHEINGVALTVRQLVAFALRRSRPMLAIHGGKQPAAENQGVLRHIELRRGRLSVPIDSDLEYDLFFWKNAKRIRREIEAFRPMSSTSPAPGNLDRWGPILRAASRSPWWHHGIPIFISLRLAG